MTLANNNKETYIETSARPFSPHTLASVSIIDSGGLFLQVNNTQGCHSAKS